MNFGEVLQYGALGLLALVLFGFYLLARTTIPPLVSAAIDALKALPVAIEREGNETRSCLRDLFSDLRDADRAEHDRIDLNVRLGKCRYGPTPAPGSIEQVGPGQYRRKLESR